MVQDRDEGVAWSNGREKYFRDKGSLIFNQKETEKMKVARAGPAEMRMNELNTFRVQEEQLAQIYSLLSDDQDKFGNMTLDDLRDQVSRYKSK